MRLVTFQTQDNPNSRPGLLRGEEIVDLTLADSSLPGTLRGILAQGNDAMRQVEQCADSDQRVALAEATLLAPIPDPQKVICIGLNYRDHAEETGAPIPKEPVVFSKFPTAVTGPGAPIELPQVSDSVDYEAELVIVIGLEGRDISKENAADYVAGYMVGHDVSARDWQTGKDARQWLLGKSFDSFAPTGPYLATSDEIADPHALAIEMRLNGTTMQKSTTEQMIFRTDELIAYVSQVFTLVPGDIIFTGTPPGVGMARKPPVFLKPGDQCEVEIEGLGVLSNPCTARG
ncbi:Ureidoglycolate lyase [Planctomycetes bacterium Pan216]|uniref:Ureidoglycolate lyase n=1 Tax=Kolteria novifilia TaxID=2527975 RepID=A0A518B177_9BACT|nr:Ureidoglycolate lyase [Planctomycetes bacterium Pan216]